MQETRFDLSQRDPQEQDMATPVFLLGKSHGKRSLVGYTPRSNKEWDTSEVCTHTHTHTHTGLTLQSFMITILYLHLQRTLSF